MTIEADVITLPSCWASALINGDQSGMTTQEVSDMNVYLKSALAGGWSVVSDIEDSKRFTWQYHLYSNSSCNGGEVMDYVIHRIPR